MRTALVFALFAACAHGRTVEPTPQPARTAPPDTLQFPTTWCDGPWEPVHRLSPLALGAAAHAESLPKLRDIVHVVTHDAALTLATQCPPAHCAPRITRLVERFVAISHDQAIAIGAVTMESKERYNFRFIVGNDEPPLLLVCSDEQCQLGVDVVKDRVRYNYATNASIRPSCRSFNVRSDFFDPRSDTPLRGDDLSRAID